MFVLHATKKLLDRVGRPDDAIAAPTTRLGNWYATALFWKPQVALFVNEHTLLPVFMPLAPASTLLRRFPPALATILGAHGVDASFIDDELAAMADHRLAKTANRSVVGIMNDFCFLADARRAGRGIDDLISLSLSLARTPCGPLAKRHGFPDRELHALVASWGGPGR
jgi:hypothetical protein